jgi:hypothetical protein
MNEQEGQEPDNVRCECGHVFAEHKKPPIATPWDICSFPCSRCTCVEFCEAKGEQ